MTTSTVAPEEAPDAIRGPMARLRAMPIWGAGRVRDFRLLWAGEAVSVLGDQFHAVALSWLVITLTGSGLALGVVLIAVSVPRALLLMPMGVLADRRPARSLMLSAHIARAAIVAVIAALAATGHASIPALALLGVLFGCADAVYLPSQQAFVPRAVGPDRLPSANALLQGTLQLVSIAGPPLAGLVVAAAGTGIAFGVDALSFLVAAALVALISRAGVVALASSGHGHEAASRAGAGAPPAPGVAESYLSALRSGLRYVLADRGVASMLAVSLVLNLALVGPGSVGMAWLAELRYHAGATGLGLLVAGWALGGLAGTVIAGGVRLERQGRLILTAIAVSGAAMAGVGLAGSLPVAVVLFAVGGLCIGYVNIIAVSWLQARVELAMIGRVMGLVMLVGFGISPLSMAVAGAMLDVNATALFAGAGIIVIAAALGASASGTAELFDGPRARSGDSAAA